MSKLPENVTPKKLNLGLQKANEESHRLACDCICTALLTLMAQTPFDKITTTAIINRSGISRAAFYRNYDSKADVLKDIVFHLWLQLNEVLNNPLFYKHPKPWIEKAFANVQNDSIYSEVLKKGMLPIELFLDDLRLLDLAKDTSIASYYGKLGTIYALWGILTEWCRRGMKETPEEMAKYVLSTINFQSLKRIN